MKPNKGEQGNAQPVARSKLVATKLYRAETSPSMDQQNLPASAKDVESLLLGLVCLLADGVAGTAENRTVYHLLTSFLIHHLDHKRQEVADER